MLDYKSPKNSKGFTLVELLISIGLVLIIGTIGTNMIASILRSYNKAHIINEIEQNGNYVLSLMESQIRNAKSVVASDCTGGNCSTLKVTPQEGLAFNFRFADDGDVGKVRKDTEVLTNDDPVSGVDVDTSRSESYFTVDGNKVTIVLKLTQAPEAPGGSRTDYHADTTLQTTVVVRGGYE